MAPGLEEYGSLGLAVRSRLAGITLAWTRLKPESLVPKAQSPQEEGFERVLLDKYYVDEIYDAAIVRRSSGVVARSALARRRRRPDRRPRGERQRLDLARFVGWMGSQLQSGQLGTYAWVLVLGVLVVLGAFSIR